MKKYILSLLVLSVIFSSFSQEKVNWLSWEEAMKKNETENRLIFIDVYTDWCGWCKVMDKKTFTDPEVVKQLNEHFYAVKFNAEAKTPINFSNHEFKNTDPNGRRGTHELAIALLDQQMSYPSFVMLTSEYQRLHILKGFNDAPTMKKYFQFYIDEKYKIPPTTQENGG